jgi:hypothetical protein
MTIDPRIAFWFGVWTSVLLLVASGTINFTGALPDVYVPIITKWCAILGAINSTILTAATGYSGNKAGPLVSAPLPPAATVAKILIVAFVLSALLGSGSAQAQTQGLKRPQITGNVIADTKANLGIGVGTVAAGSGNPLGDIIGALDVKLLPDLQYALKLATASGSKVTAPCYQAWIDIINVRQKAVQDDATPPQALPMPDPHLITDFEKLVELRNSLQPDSEFMIRCSPVASMVKKDIVGFIGIVISGGAGLATLVPGL